MGAAIRKCVTCGFRCGPVRCCGSRKSNGRVHVDYSENTATMGRYAISDDAGALSEMDAADEMESMGGSGGYDPARERSKAMKAMMKAQEDDVPAPHAKTADGFSMW